MIKLQRNGKVFLHPAALLAALIWSIYVESEDLVTLAPDPEQGPDGLAGLDPEEGIALLNEISLTPMGTDEATAVAQFMDITLQPDQIVGLRQAETARADEDRESAGFREFIGKSALIAAATPVAVGLSSIAIAFGLMRDSFSDPAFEPDSAALDLPLPEGGLETGAAKADTPADGAQQAHFDLAAVLQSVFEQTPAPDLPPVRSRPNWPPVSI